METNQKLKYIPIPADFERHICDKVNEARLKQKFMMLAFPAILEGTDLNWSDSENEYCADIVSGYRLLMEGIETELHEEVKELAHEETVPEIGRKLAEFRESKPHRKTEAKQNLPRRVHQD